jgi:two-component sensor histidine kinase
VVLDELVSNVIHHGLKDSKEHFIEVSLHRDGHDLVVEVEDDGVGPPGGGRATTILPWTRRRWQRALS